MSSVSGGGAGGRGRDDRLALAFERVHHVAADPRHAVAGRVRNVEAVDGRAVVGGDRDRARVSLDRVVGGAVVRERVVGGPVAVLAPRDAHRRDSRAVDRGDLEGERVRLGDIADLR